MHYAHQTLASGRVSLLPVRTALILLQGVVSVALGGVSAYINAETEESWMELVPDCYDPEALNFVINSMTSLGYVLMDEPDAIEEREGGVIRNYLTQAWFPEEEVVMAAS